MSHLPGYNETAGAPKSSPPISDEVSNGYNNEKKDQHYMPSEGVYVGADGDGPREEETIRALKPRQISMIAIGGAIVRPLLLTKERNMLTLQGTGLVIGSGTSLARSGPGSLFISYVVMGIV